MFPHIVKGVYMCIIKVTLQAHTSSNFRYEGEGSITMQS